MGLPRIAYYRRSFPKPHPDTSLAPVIVTLPIAFLLLLWPSPEEDSAGALAEAEAALVRIDYGEAEEALHRALDLSPSDPTICWKLARVHVLMAEETGGEEHLPHLRSAEEYARQSIDLDPERSEGYTWLAATLGYRALLSSTGEQLDLLHELLNATDRAILLNPADDIAHSIRGSTFRALGRVGWLERSIARLFYGALPEGGFEEAESSLREAVRLAPEIMRHRYELAVLFLDMGREEEARQMLTEAATLPVRIASDVPRLEIIRELLSEEHPSSPDPLDRRNPD